MKIVPHFLDSMGFFVKVGDQQYVLTDTYQHQADGFYNFKSRKDDVWIITHPRSGTTMTQELVWIIQNDMDFETAKKFPLEQRAPDLEASLYPEIWENMRVLIKNEKSNKYESIKCDNSKFSYEIYDTIPSPRCFKSHLPLSLHKDLLENEAKVIYIARDPRDRLVSHYRFITSGKLPYFKGSLEDFWNLVKNDQMFLSPYWSHVKEAWVQRNHPNVFFIFYEELRQKLPETIKKLGKFLGKELTDEEIKNLCHHLDIDEFRKNPMVNRLAGCSSFTDNSTFIGKGSVGGYKQLLTPELQQEINQWININIQGTGISFPLQI